MQHGAILREIYDLLLAEFGPQNWWPADSSFEVFVGAILTQNSNWQNVEKAIFNLKEAGCLSLSSMSSLPVNELAMIIRPCGYYNVKAGRLKSILDFLQNEWNGDLTAFLQQDREQLRQDLLALKGIGPETADSIILYGADLPVFVVDAYTQRFLFRHGLISEDDDYSSIQELFMDNLAEDTRMFNEYHALIVKLGKEFCHKRKPKCAECPLNGVNGFSAV